MPGPRSAPPPGTPADPAPEEHESRLFQQDDSDVTESEEFDRAVSQAADAMQAGDPMAARGLLERALRFRPRNQRARSMLGLALFKLGELRKAEAIYRGLIEDHPDDPTLRVNLGLVFLKAGALTEAVHCFETALDLTPDHQKAMNYLGLALAQKGEHSRAREWFQRCGNQAMEDRMAQALRASPIRQVAQAAEAAIEGARPFRSALDSAPGQSMPPPAPGDEADGAGDGLSSAPEPDAADSHLGEPRDPGAFPTPPQGSRWVATTPASALAEGTDPADDWPPPPLPPVTIAHPQPDHSSDFSSNEGFAVTLPPPATNLAEFTDQRRLSVPSGEGGFVIGETEVLIQVRGEMLLRLDGLVASWGGAAMRPELKRFRGKATDKPFGEGTRRMLRASGEGRFVIARENRSFTALELDDEPAYFREEILFAFEESLIFENGRVPSKSGTDLHLVHLRGRGRLLLVTAGNPRSVAVTKSEPLRIPMDQLVGWHGPLIQPRLVPIVEEAPEMGVALELAGEGRALVDTPDRR
jgi:Tfp pilus assembly protein PilF/uncharacterized protein (AIM24 family)